MPPDSSPTLRSAHCARPTSSSCSRTMRCCSAGVSPRSSRPSPTFSATVRQGSSPNCWNTIATRSRRMCRRSCVVAAARRRSCRARRRPAPARASPGSAGWPRAAASTCRIRRAPSSRRSRPAAIARLAPATPSTTPYSAASSSRLAPASSFASAAASERSPLRPRSRGKRMSTLRNSRAALIRSFRGPAG